MCSSEVMINAKGRILIPKDILEKAKLKRVEKPDWK
jgi:bifunctional DNA-binding transcriptional regulator/antitoxin component of YhaV-PrlF toxin-antitoxin module